MATPSPVCTVGGNPTPVDVAASSTISGQLASSAAASLFFLTCIGTDDSTSVGAVNATLAVNASAHTFSFTSQAVGSAYIFQSTVGVGSNSRQGAGCDANNIVQPSYTTTFKVNVKAANGLRVLSTKEGNEQNSTFGSLEELNAAIRTIGGGGGGASVGLAANRPAATGSGKVYACLDVPVLYVDDPTLGKWAQFATEYLPAPAAASAYTVVGPLSLAQYGDVIRAVQANDGDAVMAVALVPGALSATSPWVVTFCATFYAAFDATYPAIGVCVANGTTSGTSQCWSLCCYFDPVNSLHGLNDVIGTGTRNAVYQEEASFSPPFFTGTGRFHARLLNDGANLHMQLSPDGFQWLDWWSMPCPSSLTEYGFCVGTEGGGGTPFAQVSVFENELTTLTLPQQGVTACTGNGVPVVVTVGSVAGFQVGDYVSVHGMAGNTTANTGTGGFGTGTIQIRAIDTSTDQLTLNATGNGTWTSGGTITLLSR